MGSFALQVCKNAHMSERVSPNDLLVLREVARRGRYTRAAEALGIDHTTVARRIAAVERSLKGRVLVRSASGWQLTTLGATAVEAAERVALVVDELATDLAEQSSVEDVVRLSTPDAFAVHIASPAAARLRRRHRGISVEIITATRRAASHRSGLDIEVVVGRPTAVRAEASRIGGYSLGLYGTPDYLDTHGRPASIEELPQHRIVYFIASMLQLDDLDVGRTLLPEMADAVTSTNVFVHVQATRAGTGLGLLPTFLAAQHADIERVLAGTVQVELDYWTVTRQEELRRPAVRMLLADLQHTFQAASDEHGVLR